MSASYEIEFRWKEEVVYWEGDRGYLFDGGWGVDPPVTCVPDEASWDRVVPVWLQGRREEVIGRLRSRPGHAVRDDPDFQGGAYRDITRPDLPMGVSASGALAEVAEISVTRYGGDGRSERRTSYTIRVRPTPAAVGSLGPTTRQGADGAGFGTCSARLGR